MATKQFTETQVDPIDILDGTRTLSRKQPMWTMDAIPQWIKAEEYLTWAKDGLHWNTSFGFDVAVCYAKRAVCRLIYSFLIHNHLRDRERNYPEKIELLRRIGVVIPDIAHDLVIDPRNDIEHGYQGARRDQARHAVQLAELLLKSLWVESQLPALISLGLNYGPMFHSADNDGEPRPWGYGQYPKDTMLVVDMLCTRPKVLLIDHAAEEARFSALGDFTKPQAIDLVMQLREQLAETHRFMLGCPGIHFADFRRRLGISD
jgi:hypothetical protein